MATPFSALCLLLLLSVPPNSTPTISPRPRTSMMGYLQGQPGAAVTHSRRQQQNAAADDVEVTAADADAAGGAATSHVHTTQACCQVSLSYHSFSRHSLSYHSLFSPYISLTFLQASRGPSSAALPAVWHCPTCHPPQSPVQHVCTHPNMQNEPVVCSLPPPSARQVRAHTSTHRDKPYT